MEQPGEKSVSRGYRPYAVSMSVRAVVSLIKMYPARTRQLFGDDLIEVTTELIQAAFARGGCRAVLRLWPHLLRDFGTALVSEHCDDWRDGKFTADRFACICLVISSAVWALIVAASAFELRWAASMLDANLFVTMALAFGLPPMALLASRLRPVKERRALPVITPLRVSATATIGSWSMLACHLAQ